MSESTQQACPDISKQETRKKQLYLKNNIMTSGYDPDDFATYLEEEKEGGIDIENWTLEELETVVHLFKKSRDVYKEEDSRNNGYDPDDIMFNDPPPKKKSDKISDPNSAVLSMHLFYIIAPDLVYICFYYIGNYLVFYFT
jgi:hypothetical protein